MMAFAPFAIPVVTPLGEAYLIYVESGNWPENDIWTCAMCDTGKVFHFVSTVCSIHANATYGIKKPTE